MSKELSEIVKAAEEIAKAFRDVKGLKDFIKYQEDVKQKQKELKEGAERLTTAQKQLNNAKERYKTALSAEAVETQRVRVQTAELNRQNKLNARETLGLVGAYERLGRELSEVRTKFKNAAAEYGVNSKEAQKYAAQLRGLDRTIRDIDAAAGQHQRNVGNYASALGGLGKNLMGAFGVVGGLTLFASVMRSSFETIKSFDSSQSELAGILGVNKSQIKDLTDLTLELGSTTAFTATEATKAATELAKLGFNRDQIKDSLKGTLDAAIAFRVELPEASALVASTLKAFNLDASQTQRVVSTLAVSTTKSALDFNKLETALANVAPAAAAANYSVEQTTALLGLVVDKGIDASTAGTSLRNIFIELSANGMTLDEALTQIATSQDKLTTANELFGKRNAVTAIALADSKGRISELTDAITDQDDALANLVNERLDNLEGDLTLLDSAWEGLILSMEKGDGTLATISRGFIQATTALLNFMAGVESATEAIRSEQIELNKLVSEITSSNISEENRLKLINELKTTYPGFLENLDAEKVTNGELLTQLNKVNDAYVAKIALSKLEGKYQAAAEVEAADRARQVERELELYDKLNKAKVELSERGLNVNIDRNDLEGSVKRVNEAYEALGTNGERFLGFLISTRGSINATFRDWKTHQAVVKASADATERMKEKFEQGKEALFDSIGLANNLKTATEGVAQSAGDAANQFEGVANALNTGPDLSTRKGVKERIKQLEEELDVVKRNSKEEKRILSDLAKMRALIATPTKRSTPKKKDAKTLAKEAIDAEVKQLEYFMFFEELKNKTLEESEKYFREVENRKEKILKDRLSKRLITQKEYEVERKKLELDTEKSIKKVRDDIQKINATRAKEDLRNFELRNQSLINATDELTDELIKREEERLDKLKEEKIKALEEEYQLDAESVEEKFKNGENLYENELAFYDKILSANDEFTNKVLENEKKLTEQKRKEYEERLEKLEGDFEAERELTQEYYDQGVLSYEDYQKKLTDIDERAVKAKAELEAMKLNIAVQGLDVLAQLLGKETEMGKAAAVASTTISTYLSAQEAYENVLNSPLSKIMPDGGVSLAAISAGIAVAQGLMRVRSIISTETPAFEQGTDFAPYTGKAIVDEKGPEIHLSKEGKVKSMGKKGGARLTNIQKGDKIIPFEQSEAIKRAMQIPIQLPNVADIPIEQPERIDYDKVEKAFNKALSKHPNKQFLIDKEGNMVEITTTANSIRKRIFADFRQAPTRLR